MNPRPTNAERLEKVSRWERDLYSVYTTMESFNGDHGDDVEALVRIAWKMVYDEKLRLESGCGEVAGAL